MKRWTLNNPHPDHLPSVGRTRTGLTWNGGQCYGTTLRCSCGEPGGKVSNEAPSAGGTSDALRWYRRHLGEVLPTDEQDNGMRKETHEDRVA